MHARQTAANHPLSEKKIMNINISVATTFTKSGIVCAIKVSIFSIFCSIVFFIAPVEDPFKKPKDNRPICSDNLTRNPYNIRKAATCEAISAT